MTAEPIDKWFGMPLEEWVKLVPDDLDGDAVGLWQIIPSLRKAFGLDDAAIERTTREILAEFMARGARPVVGSCPPDARWIEVTHYGDSAAEIIDGVIKEWQAMGGTRTSRMSGSRGLRYSRMTPLSISTLSSAHSRRRLEHWPGGES